MSKVIGIAGSPRRKGNSATLMRAVLQGAAAAGAETDEIYLNRLTYQGCQGCMRCSPGGRCILNDELTPALAALREAEAWVLATPIYYDSVSGQMKAFFDRCRTFTKDPATQALTPQLQGKRQGVVIVTYEDHDRAEYYHEAEKLASYLGWMGDFGNVDIIFEGDLGPPDAAANRPDLLAQAEALGRHLFS